MSALPAILSRLDAGPPIILGCDPIVSLQEIGAQVDGAVPLGRLLREKPAKIAEHHRREAKAGIDVLVALTADTMPRALANIGMAFRAAALTRCAVELALEAASEARRPITVAGVLGNRRIDLMIAERISEECSMHAARLAASGCELVLARGFARAATSPMNLVRLSRLAAVTSAKASHLPTWAVVELMEEAQTPDGEALESCVASMAEAGADALLLDVQQPEVAIAAMKRLSAAKVGLTMGVLLRAEGGAQGDPGAIDRWVKAAKALAGEGARVLGGGLGTSVAHVAALATSLHEPP